ncbi:hypothetical protein SUGI_0256490 [Cryptomeria japonica]|nr:hypothetical protein SUGI_0256490 [Cryptomeria japonica]
MAKEFLKTHDFDLRQQAPYIGGQVHDLRAQRRGAIPLRRVVAADEKAVHNRIADAQENGVIQVGEGGRGVRHGQICVGGEPARRAPLQSEEAYLFRLTQHRVQNVCRDKLHSLSCFPRLGRLLPPHACHNKVFDEFADKLIDEHIERRRVKKSEKSDIVDVMLDMAEIGSAEIQVSRLHMKAIITDMLIAGVETSTTTIEWAMTELLRNPQAMSRAQEEIELKVGRDRMVRESDLVSLHYLRCVVKETLRLHAPAPLLMAHESTQGCNVGEYYIPPETRLFVNVWAIGRDERVWEDPLEFKPERFIGSSIDVNGHHFELLSFGTGRRGCPGIYMGLSSVYLVVAQLIHCFHWNVEGDLDREETFGLTLPKKFPISAFPSWKLTTDNPS